MDLDDALKTGRLNAMVGRIEALRAEADALGETVLREVLLMARTEAQRAAERPAGGRPAGLRSG